MVRSRSVEGSDGRPRNLPQAVSDPAEHSPFEQEGICDSRDQEDLPASILEYYQKFFQDYPATFNSFALQSRSEFPREIYARSASRGRYGLQNLIHEIHTLGEAEVTIEVNNQKDRFDPDALLALATYLSNTAKSKEDIHAVIKLFQFSLLNFGSVVFEDKHKLLFVEALADLQRYSELASLVDVLEIRELAPLQVELIEVNRIAHESGDPHLWLDAMNSVYRTAHMSTIGLREDASLPLLDRLVPVQADRIEGPMVSVLMPTYRPKRTIFTALDSLLAQTWQNIEIIVVDDGSPEEFEEILSEVEGHDPRIRVIKQKVNAGAYVSRNAGLEVARGPFITTHDDDDWSHPEKIATQVGVLLADDSKVATTSSHIRTTEDMRFRRINAQPRHLQTNYSSLLFRKVVTDMVGGWDVTNRGSDTELVSRIAQNFGKASVVHLGKKPLSFSRVWEGSLTSGEVYRGYFAYSRLLFRWSYQQWHSRMRREGKRPLLKQDAPRPYAIPTTFEAGSRHKDLGMFDVIYVTDFTRRARFVETVLDEMTSAVKTGMRVGYMHINSPQTRRRAGVSPKLFNLQLRGEVTQVAENNVAETRLMIVYDAAIGMFLDNFSSTLVVRRGVVVHDTKTRVKGLVESKAFDPTTVIENLDNSFNTRFDIVGAAHEDHEALRPLVSSHRLVSNRYIWQTHISVSKDRPRPPSDTPIVGFHSFEDKYRWPSEFEIFKRIYISDDYRTLLYGRLDVLRDQYGAHVDMDGRRYEGPNATIGDFFQKIDFWVYWPHKDLIDRPWKPVLRALRAGKVVILPRRLEPLYGGAALYADSNDVPKLVEEYGDDPTEYLKQAKRGQEFLSREFSRKSFKARLVELAS